MTPQEYEHYVAELFNKKGYQTIVTPQSNDWGVDVIATKGTERIAIQAKMYGGSRKVNRAMIMQLYGAMAVHDCNKAVLATDGELLEDAISTAAKLGIEIIYTQNSILSTISTAENVNVHKVSPATDCKYPSFDECWQQYIIPLKGQTLHNSRGANKIVDVNWSGITRITSTGKRGKIDIEGFRLAYNTLLDKGEVSRDYVNQQFEKRCSSGIFLILQQLPFVSLQTNPMVLKLKTV